jgi:hypothetical protein
MNYFKPKSRFINSLIEILIDRSGMVVGSHNGYGYNEGWAQDLENELKLLLAQQK